MNEIIDIVPQPDTVKTGVGNTKALAEALGKLLADTYCMVFKTHAYHWNVEGPLFYSVHNLTEAQYSEMFIAADELAERIRALGQLTPHRLTDIVASSTIADRKELPAAREMVEDLAADHEKLAKSCHMLIELADKQKDPVTVDLATRRSSFHEKAAWMLRVTAK